MDEIIFFTKDKVSVTNSRFIVDGQTYAISNVTSVKSGTVDTSAVPFGMLLFGGLAGWIGTGWFALVSLLIAFIGLSLLFSPLKNYSVILNTSAGETQALSSTDKEYIDKVVDALNQSIVSRG